MDYFSFGNFDPNNLDIAFSATNQYSSPASELETRKQLSYPLKELKDYINDLKDYVDSRTGDVYPVGSIYMSVNNTNPSTLFPNTTWEQLKDRFLLGAGDTYTAGDTGGEATHTLTVDEMPAHTHTYSYRYSQSSWSSGSSGDNVPNMASDSPTGSTGGGQAHNNMPPYLVVYIFKRTA